MLLFKMKLVAMLLGTSVSMGRHHMVTRQAEDIYSVPGEGEIYTQGCGFTSPRMTVELQQEAGKRWLSFYDESGEFEGACRVVSLPRTRIKPKAHPIPRAIAVTK